MTGSRCAGCPTTEAGKWKAAQNGRHKLPDPKSRRQIRASLADVDGMIARMGALRRSVLR